MANVIKHKRGSGSDPSASNLVVGELAIRTDTGKLFTKMDSGSIAEIAGGGSDIAINTLSASSGSGGNNSGVFDSSATRFTLSSPPNVSAAQLLVSVNGVIQKPVLGTGTPSEGFSVDGNDIIFSSAPETGADFFILTFRSLGVSEPADNSVTSAKIVDGTITGTDLATNVDLVNNQKIRFGANNELEIFRSGTESVIVETQGNNLNLAGNRVNLLNQSRTEVLIQAIANGGVELYHNNVKKFETTSLGVSVTGRLTTLSTDQIPATLKRDATGTSSALVILGNNTQTYAFEASSSGFSINDYTSINTARFSIDSSGNSKVHKDLIIQSNFPRIFLTDNDTNPDYSISNANGIFAVHDETNSADRFTIDSLGSSTFNGVVTIGGTSVSVAEGGEIRLTQAPNSTLAGSDIVFDTVNNGLRFFESASPFKGMFIDLSTCASGVGSQIMTSTTGVTYTGTMTFGSGAGIDLSSNDVYLNARVIQNSAGGTDDGLYLGYGNAGSTTNTTKIFGGGSTTHHFVYDTTNFYPGTDNHSSLGLSANRFKTLYLSDGVNFGDFTGGTSYSAGNVANTLDSYEEGTWTPSYNSMSNVGSTISAKYVKIGQVVHISFNNFQNNNNMSVSGLGAYINGLPFIVSDIQGIFIGGYPNKDVSGSYVVSDGVGNRIILGTSQANMRHIWAGFTYRTTA